MEYGKVSMVIHI
jgi:hypothetical protein